MKLTLEQAVLGYSALQRIGNEKFPIKISYELQRNMRILQPDVEHYEEKRIELIKTSYGVQGENDTWAVPPEKLEEFSKELKVLGSIDLSLDIHTINIDTININIAPNDLFVLEWMFVTS